MIIWFLIILILSISVFIAVYMIGRHKSLKCKIIDTDEEMAKYLEEHNERNKIRGFKPYESKKDKL